MKKIRLFFTVLMVFATSLAFTQNIKITGTVTDASTGEPIPFASLVVKGTQTGVSTGVDGTYSINAAPNATLVFSSIGYEPSEVAVSNRTVVNVALTNASIALEDVLVVAYGTVRREAKTGSVSTVKGEGIAEIPVSSVDKMLAGKMAGVQVTAASGQPGAASQIRVRGTSSINAGSEPLWVVDGIPVMNGDQSYFANTSNAISAINPTDIESITILKDAAAASVYGSRAANGVILVTTKSGKEGKSKFNVRAKYGVSQLANDNNYGMMNGAQLLDFQRQACLNAGVNPDSPTARYYRPLSLLDKPQTNWVDHLSRIGNMEEYEINASGGNAKGKFYSSMAYQKNEGVYYGIDFSKFTARVNADYKLTNNLEAGARINVAYTETNDVAMQSLYYVNPAFAGMAILPWTPAYNADGTHNVSIAENSNTNPRATALYDQQFEKQYRFQGSYYLQWEPVKNLVLKSTNAAEGTFGEGRRFWAAETNEGEATLQSSTLKYMQLTTSNTLTYANTFNDVHAVRALIGQEAMRRTYNSYYIYSPNVDPAIPYPTTSTAAADEGGYEYSARTLMSYLGIFDYSYASRYYVQGSIRYDGSSLFGITNQWGLFWSASASWNIHNESWMKNQSSWLDILKLRLSYGVNGNDNISPYMAYGVYASSAYNGVTGMAPSSPSNSNLSWEKNKSLNIGLDFGFFGRLNGNIDVYRRLTTDMLLSKNVPQTSGFSSNFLNIGELLNQGIEFQLEGDIITSKDITWNAGLNIAYNKTELLNLGDNKEIAYSGDSRLKHIVGMSLYTFYLKEYYGVNPSNGEALWVTEDGSLSNNYAKGRFINAGSPEPTITGGFNTTFSWKGLNLSAFFEFKGGNKVMIIENRYFNADGNQMSMNQTLNAMNYWKKAGDVGVNPKPIAGTASNSYAFASTRWLQDGSYCRIKDVTLSYNLPKKLTDMAKIGGLKVYVSALNLFTFHDVDFWDPERGVTGIGAGIYPMTKTIICGLELSF